MDKVYEHSWQAIGLSSDPSITRDPISLHMQNYLKWGSRYSRSHLVVVDDCLQTYSYIARRGFSEWATREEVECKGMRKLRDLQAIANVCNLKNISFSPLSTILREGRTIEKNIASLYHSDARVQQKVLAAIPERFCSSLGDAFAPYVIGETAMMLQLGGTRISHSKRSQRTVNDFALFLQKEYGLGKPLDVVYPSELGQEFELGRHGKVEPYSAAYPERRILLSDSLRGLVDKCSRANPNERREFSRWLTRTSGRGLHPLRSLYNEHLVPGKKALRTEGITWHSKRIGSAVMGLVLFGIVFSSYLKAGLTYQEIYSPIIDDRALREGGWSQNRH